MAAASRCHRSIDSLHCLLLSLLVHVGMASASASAATPTTTQASPAANTPTAAAGISSSSVASAASAASPLPDAGPNLTAYDCAHPEAKRAIVDLASLPECAPPVQPFRRPVIVRVLRARQFHLVHVYTCRVDVAIDLVPCRPQGLMLDDQLRTNLTSHKTILTSEILGRAACKKLHKGQPYTGDAGKDLKFNRGMKANSTTTDSTRNASLECNYDYVDSQNQAYAGVHVNKTVKISLNDFWVTERLDSKGVALPSGKTCVYEEAYCTGVPEGEALWDLVPNERCGDKHSLDVCYEGAAYITNHPLDNTEHVVFTDNSRNKTISYRLGNRTQVCKDEAFLGEGDKMEAARVILVLKPPEQKFSFMSSSLPSVEDSTCWPTALLWAGEDSWYNLDQLLTRKHRMQSGTHASCLRDRHLLHVKLEAARASADPVAALAAAGILDKDVRGLQGVVVGGVLHLKQCVPVAVRLRAARRCYQEVPVTVVDGSAAAFMTPSRGLLVFDGQEVPCDPLAPPMHRLAGEWFTFEPDPRRLAASEGTMVPTAVGSGGRAAPVFAAAAHHQQGSEAALPLSPHSADVFECTALRGSLLSGMAVRAARSSGAGGDRGAQTWRVFSEGDWVAIADKTGLRRFTVGVSTVLVVAVVVAAAKAAVQAWACRRLRLVGEGLPWWLYGLSALSPGLLVAVKPRGATLVAVPLQGSSEFGSLDTMKSWVSDSDVRVVSE